MRCYEHQTSDAVAVCRHCGKGVCVDCSQDSPHGVSCSNTCALELRQHERLMSRLRQAYGIGAKLPMPASIPTYFFFGLILLLTGFIIYFTESRFDVLIIAMAAVFFVMALGSYKRYRDTCSDC